MYSIILFIIYLQASHVQYYSVYYISPVSHVQYYSVYYISPGIPCTVLFCLLYISRHPMYSIILFIIYLQASHVQYYSVYYISANEQAINEN